MFTVRPLNGGVPREVVSFKPQVGFSGLSDCVQYEVTVVGFRGGAKSPVSNAARFVTPAGGCPSNVGKSLTTTTADVVITPPSKGGPWQSYNVLLWPVGGPQGLSVQLSCTTPQRCPVSGLRPLTTYIVTSVAVKRDASGATVRSPRSNEDAFTTPPAPVLISAVAWGSTTGQASASGALGETYAQVRCCRGEAVQGPCRGRAAKPSSWRRLAAGCRLADAWLPLPPACSGSSPPPRWAAARAPR